MGRDGLCCALEHLLTKPLTLPASSGSSCCFIDLTLLLISCPILEREWIAAQLQRLSDVERCVVIYCRKANAANAMNFQWLSDCWWFTAPKCMWHSMDFLGCFGCASAALRVMPFSLLSPRCLHHSAAAAWALHMSNASRASVRMFDSTDHTSANHRQGKLWSTPTTTRTSNKSAKLSHVAFWIWGPPPLPTPEVTTAPSHARQMPHLRATTEVGVKSANEKLDNFVTSHWHKWANVTCLPNPNKFHTLSKAMYPKPTGAVWWKYWWSNLQK